MIKGNPVSQYFILPSQLFEVKQAMIPLYNEKMTLFRSLGSVSFSPLLPSLLLRTAEQIFNALLTFKVFIFSSFE